MLTQFRAFDWPVEEGAFRGPACCTGRRASIDAGMVRFWRIGLSFWQTSEKIAALNMQTVAGE